MCDCIAETDKLLADEHNGVLVTPLIGKPRCVVSTAVLHAKRGARAPILLASFCPFCGEKYD